MKSLLWIKLYELELVALTPR